MGYNISDVGGETTGGPSDWGATLDLSLSNATTISGDFDVVPLFGGGAPSEATDGYDFSVLTGSPGAPVYDSGSNTYTVTSDFGTLVYNETDGTYEFTPDWSGVLNTGSDQVFSFTVLGTSGADSDDDTVSINLLICFSRGTLVETRDGPVPVEDLSAGDEIETLDNGPRPIRWIGSRKISAPELMANPSLRPVRIGAGALGNNLPRRDLLVSQQHRVFLDDWRAQLLFGEKQVLAPAKSLVDDRNIRVDLASHDIEYFHILLDEHEIVFSEGAATESFHPGAYSLSAMDQNVRAELLNLFPELACKSGYGHVARLALRPWEARVLWNAGRPEAV
jgi:hypothetical protein